MFLTGEELRTHLRNENIAAITRNDPVLIESAIDGAISEAEGYLAKFDTESIFSAVGDERNALLLLFVKDLATWHLIAVVNPNIELKHRKERYDRAVEWLKAVQSGDITPKLPVATIDPGGTIWGSMTKTENDW